ncbi:MAG: hypothetical protein AB7O49_12365 [Sphingomonadales bacterium]
MGRGHRGFHAVLRRSAHALVALAAIVGIAAPAAALPCMTRAETTAEQARGLQAGLMVAALKCVHKPSLELHESYNAFISRYNAELTSHSNVMQAYFKRAYGQGYKSELNRYMTSLANYYSLNTFGNKTFCEDMAAIAREIVAKADGAVLRGEFETRLLPATTAPMCNDPANRSMASKDVPTLSGRIPDLASIYMPDLDSRPLQAARMDGDGPPVADAN